MGPMARIPGVRVRVFGWPETWRIVPQPFDRRFSFRIELAKDSTGRPVPPFLDRTEWIADDLDEALSKIKEEIRDRAQLANRRAFMVDEQPEDL